MADMIKLPNGDIEFVSNEWDFRYLIMEKLGGDAEIFFDNLLLNNSKVEEHELLCTNYEELSEEHEELKDNYEELEMDYFSLGVKCNMLEDNCIDLKREIEELKGKNT